METTFPTPPPLSAPALTNVRTWNALCHASALLGFFFLISPVTCSGRSSSGWSSVATRPKSMRTAKNAQFPDLDVLDTLISGSFASS